MSEVKQIGLYLHLPFCTQKCHYCDFSSWAGREDLKQPYLNALLGELGSYRTDQQDMVVSTIFMGSTPPF